MKVIDYQNGNDAKAEKGGFFSNLFRSEKNKNWRMFADAIGGKFVPGGFFGPDSVLVGVGNWTVVLDTFRRSHGRSSQTYTRVRAAFTTRDRFTFSIRPASLWSRLGELFGWEGIRIGDKQFDRNFVVQASSSEKIQDLLADAFIRKAFARHPRAKLGINDNNGWFKIFPATADELYFETHGVIKDPATLEELVQLFSTMLFRLQRLGAISGKNRCDKN